MKLIDADALIKNLVSIKDLRTLSTKTIGEAIEKTPTVDAVEVVRCKDCKWYGYYSCEMGGNNWMRDGNGFCDRGERKDGDHHEG